MTAVEAEDEIVRRWARIAEERLGCPVMLMPEATETHEWGWVIQLRVVNPDACSRRVKFSSYAVDRATGESFPVGSKGVPPALAYFEKVRARQAAVVSPVVVLERLILECSEPGA